MTNAEVARAIVALKAYVDQKLLNAKTNWRCDGTEEVEKELKEALAALLAPGNEVAALQDKGEADD